jgi:hypothetical protein
VNFSRVDRQVGIIVREHTGEALYDVPHFEGMLHHLLLGKANSG